MTIEFQAWPKIPRLNRDITITEKIDGTNGAIGIVPMDQQFWMSNHSDQSQFSNGFAIYAQSRKRLISPATDNHNFAHWVWEYADQLVAVLGEGLHYGEWWGSGIQRGYGLENGDKRFSLFHTKRWGEYGESIVPGLGVVPVLYEGPFLADPYANRYGDWVAPPWIECLDDLAEYGSVASKGFMDPEGVIVFHHAANHCFKVTINGDEAPKGHDEH
jgi:hypothetical protein